jgi:hypothetical protein
MNYTKFLYAALFAAISLSACGGKQQGTGETSDSSQVSPGSGSDVDVDSAAGDGNVRDNIAQEKAPQASNNSATVSNDKETNTGGQKNENQAIATAEKNLAHKPVNNGAQIEIRVLSIDAVNNQTKVELVNHMDEAIVSVSGRLELQDKDGNAITYSNGSPIVTPFQQMKTPYIVGPKSTTTLTLGNKLRQGVEKINITTRSAKTASGKNVNF